MRTGPVLLTAVLLAGLTACTGSTPIPDPTVTGGATAVPEPTDTLLPSPTASVSTVGGVAEGFPVDLLPVPEGSEILMSAAEVDEATGLTTVSLNLRSVLSTDDLLSVYRGPLAAAGFTETPTDPGGGLAASSTFVRGTGEVLTLGVLDREGVRTVTIGGTVQL
ncbi:hypothetical protein [Cellulomonas sp. NPDC089187]|uniref:hypothetical protein n=1 Tax=Cellulomonas sp. NPDC089187 TaxID=3154970 RepID=UPI00344A973B